MMHNFRILLALNLIYGCLSCQSTRLPDATIQRDPSPQLQYRYVNQAKGFSFDFPNYGLRFFKNLDKKAAILTHDLGVKNRNIQFYNAAYISHQERLMVILYKKSVNSSAIIAANIRRLRSKKTFSKVALTEKPEVRIDPKETIVINNYEVKLDSNIALAQIKYHAKLDKSDFLCSEYYVELSDKSLLRFVNFVDIDSTLFDETDRMIDTSWFFSHTNRFNLAYFKQPIPPLDFTLQLEKPDKLAHNTAKNPSQHKYLGPLSILHRDSLLYDTLRPEFKSIYFQALRDYYSFAGFNSEALAMRDTALGVYQRDTCNALIFNDLKLENAVNFISKNLENHRILMLNERSHLPICRLFAIQLLDSLKLNGFNYLAFETLNSDHKINKNGFPIDEDGYLNQEPMFAELIRQAVLKGFKIIGYKDTTECLPPPDSHRFYCSNVKEEKAAERIAKVLKKDSEAKVFIYIEEDQNYKDYFVAQRNRREGHKFKFMAMYLTDKMGEGPLSINQSDMVERSIRPYENPLYRCLWRTYAPEESVVLVKKDGKSWMKPDTETMLDAFVFHPRTSQEIPYEWLGKVGFKKHDLDVNAFKYEGYLTQVFYKNEIELVGKKAIPALNLPMRGEPNLELWLRPNTAYIVRIYARDSRLLKEFEVNFKP
jgi:hypothetical protein